MTSARGLNVLMISDVFFPRVNGVSTSIQTFRRELAALGHRSTLIAPAYPLPYADEPGILRMPSHRVPMDPEDRMMRSGPIRRLALDLMAEHFDLVHIQTPFVAHYLGVHLSDRLGIPRVETYHTFFEEYLYHYVPFLPKRWMKGAARRLSRHQCNDVDAVIVPSRAMADVLGAYGVTRPRHIVPTGIPLADFTGGDGAAFRARHGIGAERFMLLFVGRVAYEKNIDFLLRALKAALARSPQLTLVVAGEGPAERDLHDLARRLGVADQVRFVGYLDRGTTLLDCYRAADAFTFASRTETQGLVLLEAMALGVPVIGLAVMGTRDILEPRRGCLVPEDDEDAFADAIAELAENPGLRDTLAAEATLYAREWHADALAERLAALYRQVSRAEPAPAAERAAA
ncbi:MAG TPA: glycosyltransferase [Pelomicrobium sp.]|nr:glycosyltransferase [Pelomicrobium sp.]